MNKRQLPQQLQEILDRQETNAAYSVDWHTCLFYYVDLYATKIQSLPNRKTFAFEGLPGAGKTTFKDIFANDLKIDGIDQILPNNPDFDLHLTEEDIWRSDYLKTDLYKTTKKPIVLYDRYYVSTLSYHWAYDKIFHTTTYQAAESWYKRSISQGSLIKPVVTIYLDISLNTSYLRKGRTPDNDNKNPWMRPAFLETLVEYYDYFYSKIEPQARVITIDANRSISEVQKILKKYIYE